MKTSRERRIIEDDHEIIRIAKIAIKHEKCNGAITYFKYGTRLKTPREHSEELIKKFNETWT